MEIEIPSKLGKLEPAHWQDSRNILLAVDDHYSYNAQANTALLYMHLATNYNLSMVSPENSAESFVIEPQPPQLTPREITSLIKRRAILREDRTPILKSSELILLVIAKALGIRLAAVSAGNEQALSDLHMQTSLIRSLLRKYGRRKNKPDIYPKLQQLRPQLPRGISRERTREHMDTLLTAMTENNVDFALAIRGLAHREEFISLARRRKIGYGVFVPKGMLEIDPEMRAQQRQDYHARLVSVFS